MSSKDPATDYNAALALKDAGNAAFKTGDYKGALKNYSRIFMHIGMNPCMNLSQVMNTSGAPTPDSNQSKKDPLQKKTDILRVTAFNNMAAVYAKMGKWDDCKEKCSRVLKHDEKNTKALFRRGMAYRKLNLYDLSRTDLVKAKSIIDTTDAAIERELKLLDKDEKNAEKEFYAKMKKQMKKAEKKRKEKEKQKEIKKQLKQKEIEKEKMKDHNPNIQENLNKNNNNNNNNNDNDNNGNDEFVWDVPVITDDNNNNNEENNNKQNDKDENKKKESNDNDKGDKIMKDVVDTNNNDDKIGDKDKNKNIEQPSEF